MRAKRPRSRRSKSADSGSDRRGPGRPTADPKTVRMELRLSGTDSERLDDLAKMRAADRSSVLRALIREAHARAHRRSR